MFLALMPIMSADPRSLLKLDVPFIVEIGRRTVSVDDVLSLGPGAIFELDKHANAPLEVRVNNKRIGTGHAVKVGENFGLRLEHIHPPEQRLKAAVAEH